MLNNFELEHIAQHYNFPLTVLMKDELKNHKAKSGNYIINLESSSQGNGTHWLTLGIRNKQCFYQDSFGIILPQEVIDFCKRIPNSRLAFSEINARNHYRNLWILQYRTSYPFKQYQENRHLQKCWRIYKSIQL
jgi:hypothetical protein